MKTSAKRLLSALLAVCMCMVVLPDTMTAVDAVSPGYPVSSAYKSSSYYSALSKVTLTGNQREDIVNVALSQVGYREGSYSGDYGGADDGSYNNYTEYNYWYHNYVNSGMPVGGSAAPWCATFVSWCAEQAGVPSSILKRSTAAGHGASYFNINFYSGSSTLASSGDNDAYFKGYNYTPKKGDLFYTRSWSHVGLVVSVNGAYVTTVEGNTNNNGSSEGNGVYLRTTRKITDLYFGVPNYVVGTHTCDKGTYAFYEADHPHYKCYKCSICGQVWRNTAEPTILNTCTSCIPQKPTVSTAKSAYAAGSSVQISWNAVTGNEYYWINVYKDGTLIVDQSMANNTSYTLKSAEIGSYRVNLSANNSAGTSGSASCSFSVVEDVRPDAPNIRASAPYVRTGSSITVSWDPVKNATSYAYYVTEYPTMYVYDNSFKKGTTTETSVTFTDLPNGKYLILVVALNALGTHSWESNYLWMEFYNYDYTPTETAFLDGHMYVLYDGQMSWDLAQALCEMQNGHLVTITSEKENALVKSLIASGTGDGYWIGARNDNASDYTIGDEDYRWITGEDFIYSDWADGEPNAYGSGAAKEHFAEIRKSIGNQWNDVKHTTKNGFVLELDISKYAPVATTVHGNSKYLLFDKNTSWTEAKAYSESIGGHLVTISSAEEEVIISDLLQKGSRAWYYLGAEGSTGEWTWCDGKAVPMSGALANWGNTAGTKVDGPSGWGDYLMQYRETGTWIGIQNYYLTDRNMSQIGFVCEIDNAVFTVNYDTNNGSGAPTSQTKIQDETLTLSDTRPTRPGYAFMGWATDSNATVATYQPGDSFTANANTTLYAVWEKGCENAKHQYTYGITTQPTATGAGTLTGSCVLCSNAITVSVPKLNTADYHYSITKVATCTIAGSGRFIWNNTNYGSFYFDTEIPATGHSYTNKVTEPSCTADGYATHTCTLCDDSYKDSYTDALGHSYSDGICTRCGAEDPDYVVDANAPQVVLDSKTASQGNRVCVDLKVLNNPGFSVLNVAFLYDHQYLTLTSVENKAIDMVMTYNTAVLWDSATNYISDGVLATLNFEVAEDAPEGDYEISVVFMGASNEDFEEVRMNGVSGILTVTAVVYGDSNGDGQVTTVDLAMLRKFLASTDPLTGVSSVEMKYGADCNGDGKIDTVDLAMLRKYLSCVDPVTGGSTVVMGPK